MRVFGQRRPLREQQHEVMLFPIPDAVVRKNTRSGDAALFAADCPNRAVISSLKDQICCYGAVDHPTWKLAQLIHSFGHSVVHTSLKERSNPSTSHTDPNVRSLSPLLNIERGDYQMRLEWAISGRRKNCVWDVP